MCECCKDNETEITKNQLVMDFNDYPAVKTYGADLFQKDIIENNSDTDTN